MYTIRQSHPTVLQLTQIFAPVYLVSLLQFIITNEFSTLYGNMEMINFKECEQEGDGESFSTFEFKLSSVLMANYILFPLIQQLLFRNVRYTANNLKCSDL
jgi:hypothetical protein